MYKTVILLQLGFLITSIITSSLGGEEGLTSLKTYVNNERYLNTKCRPYNHYTVKSLST